MNYELKITSSELVRMMFRDKSLDINYIRDYFERTIKIREIGVILEIRDSDRKEIKDIRHLS